MSKCEKCKEDVNLLNAYVYFGPSWIRWVCPKCNYELNYEMTGTKPIDPYVEKIIGK
jgi:transposase-like protein